MILNDPVKRYRVIVYNIDDPDRGFILLKTKIQAALWIS
jgi:hypothetical protein